MKKRFEPVEGRNFEIIESVVNSDEVKDLPEDIIFKIRLCVEEVEENILNYSGTTWIDIETSLQDGVLSISFRDGGVEFDPLAKEDPDITSSVEDRKIGGLGIFLCKKMMTSLDYHFENGCNIFVMKMSV